MRQLLLLLLLLRMPAGGSAQRYSLKVQSPVTVQRGLCVHVPCEVIYPDEDWEEGDLAYGYWFRNTGWSPEKGSPVATNNPDRPVLKETRGRFLLTGDPGAHNCSLYIRDAKKKDAGTFFFRLERGRARYTYSYSDYLLSVRVTDLTHRPDVLIPETLVPGNSSTLTCSVPWACKQGTPPVFSWLGASVSHLDPSITSSPVLSLTPRPQDHGTPLTCQVTLPAVNVTEKTTVYLNISYPPQNLTVTVIPLGAGSVPTALANSSSLPVVQGQALRLLCAVDSHPPARLTWSWRNLVLSPSDPANPGVLELTPENLRGEAVFTCRAQNSLGSQHISLRVPLQADKEGLPQRGAGVAGVTLGATMGAGITALFFLFVFIILAITWSCRRKAARLAASSRDPEVTSGSASQGPLVEAQPNESFSHRPSVSTVACTPEEEEEEDIHYASLSFREVTPRDPHTYESVASEYSEIKIHEGEAAKTGSGWRGHGPPGAEEESELVGPGEGGVP